MSRLYVGIDLGTSNSAAAVYDGEAVSLVRNAQGGNLTPSVVRIDAKGNVVVGARARRAIDLHPQDVASEFKRLMGTAETVRFAAAQVEKTPVELSAEVLRVLRQDIQDQVGVLPTGVVISVPALFELPQCQATTDAARLAGFERIELIQEPIASALASGWTAASADGAWMVYDLGGGTFDVSLLEEQEGFLRVVGHDGDNYLGGRDFDQAVLAWALDAIEQRAGIQVDRRDPARRDLMRRLKLAAEEAKVELSRTASTTLTVEVDGEEVELELTSARLEALCAPLVERSIAVCRRLLEQHRSSVRALSRVVLVGGPTVTPFVRKLVSAALHVGFGEKLDPMTLVAQGAALHAASVGVEAASLQVQPSAGALFTLSYPTVTTLLAVTVAGRLRPDQAVPLPTQVRLVRSDGQQAPLARLDRNGAFVTSVRLVESKVNDFALLGVDDAELPVPVQPQHLCIVHGVTVGDPPLARTVGVATAQDTVREFFLRGTPLPARRSCTFRTVDVLPKGQPGWVLRVPIVQGESGRAHLCRLVGSIEIDAADLPETVPVDAEVEVTLALDRSGCLTGQARIPSLGLTFERVVRLVLPSIPPEALAATLEVEESRLQQAFAHPLPSELESLLRARFMLDEAAADVRAAQGGDVDAAQKARRILLEVDACLEAVSEAEQWHNLREEALRVAAAASSAVAEHGTPTQARMLEESLQGLEEARSTQSRRSFELYLEALHDLRNAASLRSDETWLRIFDRLAADVSQCRDVARAQQHVEQGKRCRAQEDYAGLREVCNKLAALGPQDVAVRERAFDSGLR